MAQQELAPRVAGRPSTARRLTLGLAWAAAAALTPLAAGAQQPVTKDAPATAASSADAQAVLAVVNKLFDAMRTRDSAAARSVFAPNAVLLTAAAGPDGAPRIQEGNIADFVAALGRPSEQVWDERLYDTVVHVDGNLASVWTGYDFFLGDRLSHCGVDAFVLARHTDGWKIVHLSDTRRREGCRGT